MTIVQGYNQQFNVASTIDHLTDHLTYLYPFLPNNQHYCAAAVYVVKMYKALNMGITAQSYRRGQIARFVCVAGCWMVGKEHIESSGKPLSYCWIRNTIPLKFWTWTGSKTNKIHWKLRKSTPNPKEHCKSFVIWTPLTFINLLYYIINRGGVVVWDKLLNEIKLFISLHIYSSKIRQSKMRHTKFVQSKLRQNITWLNVTAKTQD